jgi:hypothetical protein
VRCCVAQPYEAYLRSRWGIDLPEILGVQHAQLGWWNAKPAPKRSDDVPQPAFPEWTSHRRTPNLLQETAAWAARLSKIEPIGRWFMLDSSGIDIIKIF